MLRLQFDDIRDHHYFRTVISYGVVGQILGGPVYENGAVDCFGTQCGGWAAHVGWKLTVQAMKTQMSKTLPGLGNFYLVGQWVEPGGGTPAALVSGRGAIQIICKKKGVPGTQYLTQRPGLSRGFRGHNT
jgi:hypothetical protein